MSSLVHSLISVAMSLLLIAAPALCMCSEHRSKPAPEKQAHACCQQQQDQQQGDSDQDHGNSCSHCGAQKLSSDQPNHAGDVLLLVGLPIEPALTLEPMSVGVIIEKTLDPPQILSPVRAHTCSLT